MMKAGWLVGTIVVVWAGGVAVAAPKTQPRPEIFNNLLQCRSIADNPQRLACFDRQAGEIEAAAQRDEVVVLDKSELKKTRKTLFGFSFPKLPFLGGGNGEDKQLKEEGFDHIETTIGSLRAVGYGKWQIGLEDGAQWMTTDAITGPAPKVGQKIEIHRAAMGSFLGKVDGGRAVRMKRVS